MLGEMCSGILANAIHLATHLAVTIPARTFVGPLLGTAQSAGRQRPAGEAPVYFIPADGWSIPWTPSEGRPLGGPCCACAEEFAKVHGYVAGLNIRALRQYQDSLPRAEVLERSYRGDFPSAVYVVIGNIGSTNAHVWEQRRRPPQVEVLPQIIQKIEVGWAFWFTSLLQGVPREGHPGCKWGQYDYPDEFVWLHDYEVLDASSLYQRYFGLRPGGQTGILFPHLIWPLYKSEPYSFDEALRLHYVSTTGLGVNEVEQLRLFYEEQYGPNGEVQAKRRDALRKYPVPYTDANSVEHRWWPVSIQTIGQPVVALDRTGREKTENLKTKPRWGPAEFNAAERREMRDGADAVGPVQDVNDPSYDEIADLFILVLGTNLIGVCVVQLEDGPDQEMQGNGDGRVEAWPMPMWNRQAYGEAYARVQEFWRTEGTHLNPSKVPKGTRMNGLPNIARGPWIVGDPAPTPSVGGYQLLTESLRLRNFQDVTDIGRTLRTQPDWDGLRLRAKTLQGNTPVTVPDRQSVQAAQDELKRSGFVMVDNNHEVVTEPQQVASALWWPIGPGGIPRPPPVLEGDQVMAAVPPPETPPGLDADADFMHVSQDSSMLSASSLSYTDGTSAA